MTTLVLPDTIDPTGKVDIWAQVQPFIAKAKPGDVIQNPHADATFLMDHTLEYETADGTPLNGVRSEWEGATFQQRTLRPYGQTRNDGIISGGTHLSVPTGSPLIPASVNWGWVSGPGIKVGTHIVLDYNRRGGTLSQPCTDGTGLPLVFTSQADRTRAGFRDSGKDNEHHNVATVGPELNPKFTQFLEAQHGFDFAGATNPQLVDVDARHMHGDGFYPGSGFTGRLTTFLNAKGGVVDHCARSGVSAVNCLDCTIDQYVFDHVGRTAINLEPPNAGCVMDRLKVTRSIFGQHQLTLLSSGGDTVAHVGLVELSDCWMVNDDMPLWLIEGNAQHLRGPYLILRNRSSFAGGFGATYPQAALISIDNARPGSKVIDNKGFKLQPGRGMALVRARKPAEVHGNDHEGGIEVGPWV